MRCERCKGQMRIVKSYYSVIGDDSSDTITKLNLNMDLKCENPMCDNNEILSVKEELTIV